LGLIVAGCRLKKLMFIGNLSYFTTIWVVVGLYGTSSASSIYLCYQPLIWGWLWVVVGDCVFYKYPNFSANAECFLKILPISHTATAKGTLGGLTSLI
jgi:hypothetical protein